MSSETQQLFQLVKKTDSDVEQIKRLLEQKVDVNADDSYDTPLSCAVNQGNPRLDIVRCLLENNADPNKGYTDSTPFHGAVSRRNLEVMRLLLEYKANVDLSMGYDRKTPLLYYSGDQKVNLDLVRCLLENKANPNVQDGQRNTSLSLAIKARNIPLMNLLFQYKVDVNQQCGNYKLTPLMYAIDTKDLLIIESLLAHKADPNLQNSRCGIGEASLVYAVKQKEPDLNIVRMLVAYNADVNMQSGLGRTALSEAVESQNLQILSFLGECSVDVNIPDNLGDTPLVHAVKDLKGSNLPIVRWLLDNNADVNVIVKYDCGKEVNQPLFEYVITQEKINFELFKLLHEKGADVYKTLDNHCLIMRFSHKRMPVKWFYENSSLFASLRFLIAYSLGVVDETNVKQQAKLSFSSLEPQHLFATVLACARQGYFALFVRNPDLFEDHYKLFITMEDDEAKSVFDYAVEHNNKEAVLKLFETARLIKSEKEAKTSLQARCMSYLVSNIHKIDLENSDQAEKLKSVFYTLTAPYRIQEPEIIHQ